jgi:hypothetical protein
MGAFALHDVDRAAASHHVLGVPRVSGWPSRARPRTVSPRFGNAQPDQRAGLAASAAPIAAPPCAAMIGPAAMIGTETGDWPSEPCRRASPARHPAGTPVPAPAAAPSGLPLGVLFSWPRSRVAAYGPGRAPKMSSRRKPCRCPAPSRCGPLADMKRRSRA